MRGAEYFVNSRDPKALTVRQVMEDDVYTVRPDTKGSAIVEAMTERNFGAVPVVIEDSVLVGLVSEFDLLRAIEDGKDLHLVKAEEMMTRN
ncbi:MAG: CBS domain-containing protein, partial [Nitrospira sp.]|nr:CBS domain-containing protein [Nitrospira sp.]